MSETLTTAETDPEGPAGDAAGVAFPPGRYGRRREQRRRSPWLVATLTAVVVAAGLVVAWRMYDLYGRTEYSSTLLGFDDSVTGQVDVTFEVYKPAGEGAVCRIRSRDFAGAEIGVAEVAIPADDSNRVVMTYTLAVEGIPNTGEVQRCWQAD